MCPPARDELLAVIRCWTLWGRAPGREIHVAGARAHRFLLLSAFGAVGQGPGATGQALAVHACIASCCYRPSALEAGPRGDGTGVDQETIMLMASLPGDFAVLAGDDVFASALLEGGAAGGITASAQVGPGAFAGLIDAWHRGDAGRARELGHRLAPLWAALVAEPNPAVNQRRAARPGEDLQPGGAVAAAASTPGHRTRGHQPARPARSRRRASQLITRLRNERTPRYPKTAVPPTRASSTAHSGMWPTDGVSTARRPSDM
jgi:hypothetical protein